MPTSATRKWRRKFARSMAAWMNLPSGIVRSARKKSRQCIVQAWSANADKRSEFGDEEINQYAMKRQSIVGQGWCLTAHSYNRGGRLVGILRAGGLCLRLFLFAAQAGGPIPIHSARKVCDTI